MDKHLIYTVVFLITALCSLFIFLILLWNKKSLTNRKRLEQIEDKRKYELLKASIQAQESERKRIANNLHDDIGPLLSALKIKLGHFDQSEQLVDIRKMLDQTVSNVRSVSSRMSPTVLEELGLNKAIRHIYARFNKIKKTTLDLEWDDRIQNMLSKDQQANLYRIIQEGLNNIIKHSEAKQASLIGKIDDKGISILIKDNGRGIHSTSLNKRTIGLGLQSMKARAEVLKGELVIESNKEGTFIKLLINGNLI